jgi:hypothetical protein
MSKHPGHVVLVGSPNPTREDARRALRALGQSPFIFETIDELRSLGDRIDRFEMLLLVCPDAGALPNKLLLGQLRKIAADRHMPMLVAVDAGPMPAPREQHSEEMAGGPLAFSDWYNLLEGFMDRHDIGRTPASLRWDPYRFQVRPHMVTVGTAKVRLTHCDFDLAVELFFGLNRLTPLRRLYAILLRYGGRESEESLHSRITHLQCVLDLNPVQGWRLESFPEVGYRLTKLPKYSPNPAPSCDQ